MEDDRLTPLMVEVMRHFENVRTILIQYGCADERVDAALKPALDESLEMMRSRQRGTGLGHIGG